MKKKLFLALMLLPLICMIILAIISVKVYLSETSKSYPNYQSLQQAKVFEEGLLPDYIPQSVTMIELTHNHDNQNVYASFYILGDDYQSLRDACEVLFEEPKKIIFYCIDRNKELRIRVDKKGKAKVTSKLLRD